MENGGMRISTEAFTKAMSDENPNAGRDLQRKFLFDNQQYMREEMITGFNSINEKIDNIPEEIKKSFVEYGKKADEKYIQWESLYKVGAFLFRSTYVTLILGTLAFIIRNAVAGG